MTATVCSSSWLHWFSRSFHLPPPALSFPVPLCCMPDLVIQKTPLLQHTHIQPQRIKHVLQSICHLAQQPARFTAAWRVHCQHNTLSTARPSHSGPPALPFQLPARHQVPLPVGLLAGGAAVLGHLAPRAQPSLGRWLAGRGHTGAAQIAAVARCLGVLLFRVALLLHRLIPGLSFPPRLGSTPLLLA